VLQRNHVDVVGIQELTCAPVTGDLSLRNFEADVVRVRMGLAGIVHGDDHAIDLRSCARDRRVQIGGKGCDSAAPGQVIADEGQFLNGPVGLLSSWFLLTARTGSSKARIASKSSLSLLR
jgi:hypothetical protein